MRFDSLRGVAGLILALCTQTSLFGQEKSVSVPFVGCKSDGRTGPMEAPIGTRVAVPITPKAAQALAYYSIGPGNGVLAPRGWYCFGTYGSSGSALLVSPQHIDTATMFSTWDGLSGPVIGVSNWDGDTSGRFQVAEIMARVFPAYRAFTIHVMEEGLGGPFKFSPFPKDELTYRSNRVVEYKTPPQSDGLGTYLWLKKNGSPIEGVAMLAGKTPDLLLLSVRLPPELREITSVIVHQVERDARPGDRH